MKYATTISEQIQLLQERGLHIGDMENAKATLSDIGYYRLGFYWFPFEEPVQSERTHRFIPGAALESAVDLYCFDDDLRKILLPHLQRVEVNIRTHIIYHMSNQYKSDPFWFSNPQVVRQDFADNFRLIYSDIQKNRVIRQHHNKYPDDIYAPAWKTLEFATFGTMTTLYKAIKVPQYQEEIALHYGIRNLRNFDSYLRTLRFLRNTCAHGHTLYDMRLPQSIKKAPIGLSEEDSHNLVGAITVLDFLLQKVPKNRAGDLREDIAQLLNQTKPKKIYPLVSYIARISK